MDVLKLHYLALLNQIYLVLLATLGFVESRTNSHAVSDGFDHLIKHALSCNFERKDESVNGYGHICFGSLDQGINHDELMCLNDGKARSLGSLEGCSTSRAERNKLINGSSKVAVKIQ